MAEKPPDSQQQQLFLVHASGDMNLIEEHIINVLDKEYKILTAERDFRPGKTTIGNIIDAILESYKIVVVLTETSVQSNWVKYETLVALEKSQISKTLDLVVLLFDMNDNKKVIKAEDYAFGVLTDEMTIHVDRTEKRWKDTLIQEIKRERPLNRNILVANLATGQAWSHFTGYCNLVFPHLKEKIENSEWYDINDDRFPVMEFNLIPYSATSKGNLQELDERIKHVGSLEKIVAERGTYPNREYDVPVYKIRDSTSQEEKDIYFVCQIPNSLSVLSKAEDLNLTDEDRSSAFSMKIRTGERHLQVVRFYYIMNRLVNHPKNQKCNGLAKFILYDDKNRKAGDVLLEALKEEMEKRNPTPHVSTSLCMAESAKRDRDRNRRIHIECDETDQAFKEEMKVILEEKGFIVWDNDQAGRTYFDNFQNAMEESKWIIFILSRNTTHSENFKLLNFKCRSALHESITRKENFVIPVLDGIGRDVLLYELGWVTYLNRSDDNFQDRLINTLKHEKIPMESAVPATDVHQGLAWAYVMNYLSLILDDHINKLEGYQRDDVEVCKRLFIVVPSSGDVTKLYKAGEDERFQSIEEEHLQYKPVGGVPERKYQLHLFKLTGERKKFIVAVEGSNAVLCLREMANLSEISGLSTEELHKEVLNFKNLLERILNRSRYKDKATIVFFDDEKTRLADALLQILEDGEGVNKSVKPKITLWSLIQKYCPCSIL